MNSSWVDPISCHEIGSSPGWLTHEIAFCHNFNMSTIADAMKSGSIFVPGSQCKRIFDTYGHLSPLDFDEAFDFNKAMAELGPDCISTMVTAMNITGGNVHGQFDKLAWAEGEKKQVLADCFNIVSNLVRASIGEDGVWYEIDGETKYGPAKVYVPGSDPESPN